MLALTITVLQQSVWIRDAVDLPISIHSRHLNSRAPETQDADFNMECQCSNFFGMISCFS